MSGLLKDRKLLNFTTEPATVVLKAKLIEYEPGLGGITGGSFTRGHFLNQNPCAPTDKTSADCPQLGGKPWQAIPAEKTQNRFEVEI